MSKSLYQRKPKRKVFQQGIKKNCILNHKLLLLMCAQCQNGTVCVQKLSCDLKDDGRKHKELRIFFLLSEVVENNIVNNENNKIHK